MPSRPSQSATDGMTKRVGIVGGGQLGRMLALAAAPLGVACTVIDPSPDAGAQIAAEQIVAAYDDAAALGRLAASSDVITFEFENVPAAALEAIAASVTLAPPARALEVSQDRLAEKRLFEQLGIPVAPYAAVDSQADLEAATAAVGLPAVLKTRRLGYDGKGQARIESEADLATAWTEIGEAPAILEAHVQFSRELSVIAARSSTGELAFYPLTENVHAAGILRESSAPAAGASEALSVEARRYAETLLAELDYVGVLALELFDTDAGLTANEFAPRVHNSGHWTIDAAPSSQFENHLRAVLGLPLGATEPATDCTMLNLIGGAPESAAILAVPGARLHLYGKEPRAGRKIGHITVTATADRSLESALSVLRPLVAEATR
jgi:5-(carboxyamino)imidazole ribonucleotide synthase